MEEGTRDEADKVGQDILYEGFVEHIEGIEGIWHRRREPEDGVRQTFDQLPILPIQVLALGSLYLQFFHT